MGNVKFFKSSLCCALECVRRKSDFGGPLSGIRILDMTRILAGPFCTMILGDLGAEIIKIENPDGGDDTRNWGPPFLNGESAYFLSVNRNKKSIAINLKMKEGQDLIRKLAIKSDVLVENFVPGYGSSGPYSTRAGYDVIAASISGLLGITGPENGEPCKVGVAMTDLATGLYAHGAIMASLLERSKSGQGQSINCDLLSTQLSLLANIGSNYLNANVEAKRWGTAHESIVPYQAFKTKNGYITVGAGNNKQFKVLCDLLNVQELSSDPMYLTNEKRVKNRKLLVSKLSDIFGKNTSQYWLEVFDGSGIPYGPINNIGDVFRDPQVCHNKMVIEMMHSSAGKIKMTGPAVKYDRTMNKARFPPPNLGEHTAIILSSVLRYSKDEIEHLRKLNIVF